MNASTLQVDVEACQAHCAATSECEHFTFWVAPALRCDLAAAGASLQQEPPQASHAPLATSGPRACAAAAACSEVPGDCFPGRNAAASAAAWPSGEVPTNAQCWPRDSATGFPVDCPTQRVTVLEDTVTGWPGTCLGLVQIDVPTGEWCELNCMKNVLCSVWQEENLTNPPQCWQGSFGSDCLSRPGFKPARAQRIMHGSYRVLKDLRRMQVMGLTLMFPHSVYPDWKEAAHHCRNYCIAALTCEWWQYSTIAGCYVEDVSESRVKYPLTTDASQSVTNTEFANSIVAGEYIQHVCGDATAGTQAGAIFDRPTERSVATTTLTPVPTSVPTALPTREATKTQSPSPTLEPSPLPSTMVPTRSPTSMRISKPVIPMEKHVITAATSPYEDDNGTFILLVSLLILAACCVATSVAVVSYRSAQARSKRKAKSLEFVEVGVYPRHLVRAQHGRPPKYQSPQEGAPLLQR